MVPVSPRSSPCTYCTRILYSTNLPYRTVEDNVNESATENVGDCGTEGRKRGGKERKKRKKRAEKCGTCYVSMRAPSFFEILRTRLMSERVRVESSQSSTNRAARRPWRIPFGQQCCRIPIIIADLPDSQHVLQLITEPFPSNLSTTMSAIFDFSSVLMILLLMICTCTYLREMRPTIFDGGKVSKAISCVCVCVCMLVCVYYMILCMLLSIP
jgi:hypothetical protein